LNFLSKLETKQLVKSYRRRVVADHVNLEVHQGEIVGLLGPNGAGKTTTFYMIVGISRPDSGSVFFRSQDITNWPMYMRAREGISYLPQEASVFRKMTVEENLLAILETLKLSRTEQEDRLDELLSDLGVIHLAKNKASSLSGGERRRVEIARALVTSPSFILLDEPFAGIDPLAISDIQNIVRQLREKDIGVLISDHNVRETLNVCDRAYILNKGQLLEEGTPSVIAQSEKARKTYLGERFRL